jgi:NAD(P)-dependent dehydrogenase (short-subunit alcohol dehydrogenase family)
VAAVIAAFGRVDSLVNAAGLTDRGTLLDTTPELFDAHIAVNLKAPFFLMQAVAADLVARQAAGTIVNIISTSAHAGQPYLAPYVAAKSGLIGLTRNAAMTGGPRPAQHCRWASSGRSARSPSSWRFCCQGVPAWSPARSSTGTRT